MSFGAFSTFVLEGSSFRLMSADGFLTSLISDIADLRHLPEVSDIADLRRESPTWRIDRARSVTCPKELNELRNVQNETTERWTVTEDGPAVIRLSGTAVVRWG